MSDPVKGSCLCGGVRFAITGKAGPIGQCHCSKCRKVSGTDGNAVFYTAVSSFRWLSGEELIKHFFVPGGNGVCSRTSTSRWFSWITIISTRRSSSRSIMRSLTP